MDWKAGAALLAGAGIGCAATLYLMRPQGGWRWRWQWQGGYPGRLPAAGTMSGGAGTASSSAGAGGSIGAAGVGMEDVLGDDVLREQFTRNIQFFGEEAQQRLAGSFVIVVGLGGVGSHAANMLLRSGVGKLRLIDFDQVTLSSLNRHAVAVRRDVGSPKADCMARHFREIVPEAQVEALVAMYTAEDEDRLLEGAPDYVVDAIDNIDTKVALLAACSKRGIPVICSAGAGAKADPSRLRIADVSESTVDPLARTVRHRLKRDYGLQGGIPVVLSTEKPLCKLLPPDEITNGQGSLQDYQVVPNFRIRTIPVLGTSPAMFGMAAAAYVLCQLCQQPFMPEPLFLTKEGVWASQLQSLCERLDSQPGCSSEEQLLVDEPEVRFIGRDVWRGMSARAAYEGRVPKDKGLQRHIVNLSLTRWDATRPATVDNLVLLTHDEMEQHDARPGGLQALRQADPKYVQWVEQRLGVVAAMFGSGGSGGG